MFEIKQYSVDRTTEAFIVCDWMESLTSSEFIVRPGSREWLRVGDLLLGYNSDSWLWCMLAEIIMNTLVLFSCQE